MNLKRKLDYIRYWYFNVYYFFKYLLLGKPELQPYAAFRRCLSPKVTEKSSRLYLVIFNEYHKE